MRSLALRKQKQRKRPPNCSTSINESSARLPGGVAPAGAAEGMAGSAKGTAAGGGAETSGRSDSGGRAPHANDVTAPWEPHAPAAREIEPSASNPADAEDAPASGGGAELARDETVRPTRHCIEAFAHGGSGREAQS